jgi:hypothetical protein
MTVRLTSRDHELLLDLKEHGAALAEDLCRWFPSSAALRMRLVALGRHGYVEVIGRHEGQRIFALGPRGKHYLGIRSNWRTRSQEALRQIVWRRCHAQLVGEGYQRVGPLPGKLILYRRPAGPALGVRVFGTGPSARHIRAILKKQGPTLVRHGAVLCIFGSQPSASQTSSTRSSFVIRTTPRSA